MIQFNLLPDVKKEYIKAKRTKRLIFSISTISALSAVALVLMLFTVVQFAQKKSINDLSKDIETGIADIESISDINKILTIQNQLESLPGLHEQKPESSRLFTYLSQMTPADVSITTMQINFETNSITIEGTAPSIASINRYTDTVKFAKFTQRSTADSTTEPTVDSEASTAFSEVKTELSRNEETASYKITAVFEPVLFDNTKTVTLIIPNTVTTRSTQGRPTLSDDDSNPLFNTPEGAGN
jgi:Tfp pilus assembly protein PilN